MRLTNGIAGATGRAIRDICSGVLDLIYPPFCLVCKQAGEVYLCAKCIEKMDFIQRPYCHKCGIPCEPEEFTCRECHAHEFAFDSARSAGTFDGLMREAIHAFKYHYHLVLADPLAELMVRCFPNTQLGGDVDLLIPIPIHRSRETERGFNQSVELARRLGRALSLPVDTRALAKPRKTRHQVELSEQERAANLEGAFAVVDPRSVAGKRVLLIDDVFTTGATVNEGAKVLRAAGAASVNAYTLARSL